MATSEAINIPSQTFVWKHDPSAGDIPAQVYHSSQDQPGPRPIGEYELTVANACTNPTLSFDVPCWWLRDGLRSYDPQEPNYQLASNGLRGGDTGVSLVSPGIHL